jgi:hypothetical protein
MAAERVALTSDIIAATRGALATRRTLSHLLDGDADITECEFQTVNELAVTPEYDIGSGLTNRSAKRQACWLISPVTGGGGIGV